MFPKFKIRCIKVTGSFNLFILLISWARYQTHDPIQLNI
jgi:hypothetical protein